MPSANAPIRVVDSQQRQVQLPAPARRVVALSPHLAENLFSAGAGHTLVGVAARSDHPPAAARLPVVGDHNAWSLEVIAALQPDLVLMWASGNGLEKLPALERLGVPVYVDEPRRLADIPASIRRLGKLAGTGAVAEAAAEGFERAIADLRARHRGRAPVTVFYQIWNRPLQTLNGEHLVSQVLALCGARNVFADAPTLAPRVNLEAVLQRNPGAILASGAGDTRPAWLDEWAAYPSLRAVRNGALFFVHPDHIQLPTTRIRLGAARICQQLDTLRD